MVGERLLKPIELAVGGESLDRLDLCAVGLDREHHAALHEHTVDENGAGAAVAGVAADVTAGQVEVVPDEVDEQAASLDLALVLHAVDLHGDRPARDGFHLFPSCGLGDRA